MLHVEVGVGSSRAYGISFDPRLRDVDVRSSLPTDEGEFLSPEPSKA